MCRRILFFCICILVVGLTLSARAAAPLIRVMPVGDSITDGVGGTGGGYRGLLYTIMTNAGYSVDFVGSLTVNGAATLPDWDHEGHSGWRIDQIDSIILGVFNQIADPDVILVLIGTNDYGQNYDQNNATNRLNALITKMALARPYAKIIVANLLERGETDNTEIQTTFNPFVTNIVAQQAALGREVYFTDMRSAVPLSDMPDSLHPNMTGYSKMATNWFNVITNLFSPVGSTNAPAISRAAGMNNRTNFSITFTKPVEDAATNISNYAVSGGVTVLGAVLDPVTMRDVTVATSLQVPSQWYTVTVTGVRDRTTSSNLIAAGSSTNFLAWPSSVAFSNVTEAAEYMVVYSLEIPVWASYNGPGASYALDLHTNTPVFDRVAYYLELQSSSTGIVKFLWASMNSLTTNATLIGVPSANTGAFFQQPVSNMNVYSSVSGIVVGTNFSGGNVEFWPSNYAAANLSLVPNASDSAFDWGDNPQNGGYGSMQIHNHDASQVLMAMNNWGGGGTVDIGIGNNGSGQPDWTFMNNSSSYTVRRLQVLVHPLVNTAPAMLGSATVTNWSDFSFIFSKPVEDAATNLTNYAISGGLSILGVDLDPATKTRVTVRTSPQVPSTLYNFTVNGVTDRTSSHNIIATNSVITFTSLSAVVPTVVNGAPGSIAVSNATLNGQLLLNGGVPPVETWIYWGTSDGGTNKGLWANVCTNGTTVEGPFSASISNLIYGFRYYYRSYASNAVGGAWAPASTNFASLPPNPYKGGLRWGQLSGWNIAGANPETGFALGPELAKSNTKPPWADNATFVYTGEIYFNGGTYSFVENIDDDTFLKIDGTVYINNMTYNDFAQSGLINKPAGWYSVDIRFGNGGGGAGYVSMNPGFQYNTNGLNSALDADNWYPEDDGNMSLFRCIKENAGLGVVFSNNVISGVTTTSAVYDAEFSAPGVVFDVWAYWGTNNGGTNAGAWSGSLFIGAYSNLPSAGVNLPMTELDVDTRYYVAVRAVNALVDVWGGRSSFKTGFLPSERSSKMRVTFSGYDKPETLTNFPALVVLNESLLNFHYSQFGSGVGYDLVFVDETRTNELNYEIEKWDTNGSSYVWVQVPFFTNNCQVWAYWGKTNASIRSSITNGATWEVGYLGVWHLDHTNSAGLIPDSTFSNLNGTMTGSSGATGIVAMARNFNAASTNRIFFGNSSVINNTYSLTLEAWGKAPVNGVNTDRDLIRKDGICLLRGTPNHKVQFFINRDGGGDWFSTAESTTLVDNDGGWHYIAGSYGTNDASTLRLYVDGRQERTAVNGAKQNLGANSSSLMVGAANSGGGELWDGFIDEVRISSVARSSNWLWACYMNQLAGGAYGIYGVVSGNGAAEMYDGYSSASNITMSSAAVSGALSSTGFSGVTSVRLYYGRWDGGTNTAGWESLKDFGPCSVTNFPVAYSTNLTGLAYDSPYYYRFYALNANGPAWSPTGSFKTWPVLEMWLGWKMKITFYGYTNQAGTLTNFPVLVALSNNVGNSGFSYDAFCTTNGSDLRFLGSTPGDYLKHEVEQWNTSGVSYVWLQVPELSGDGTSFVWALWGNRYRASQPAYTTNGTAWNSNYKAVWHLNEQVIDEQTTGIHYDATANRYNGQQVRNGPTGGLIAGGQDLDGSDYITRSDITPGQAYTKEAWVWRTAAGNNNIISSDNTAFWAPDAENRLTSGHNGAWFSVQDTVPLPTGSWQHVFVTYNANTNAGEMILYRNGVRVSYANSVAAPNPGVNMWIGAHNGGNNFSGQIDEARISDVARSSNWVWACWISQASNDVFNSYSDLENLLIKGSIIFVK